MEKINRRMENRTVVDYKDILWNRYDRSDISAY
jgi:hypothetical protein